jgi:hypothetical protein
MYRHEPSVLQRLGEGFELLNRRGTSKAFASGESDGRSFDSTGHWLPGAELGERHRSEAQPYAVLAAPSVEELKEQRRSGRHIVRDNSAQIVRLPLRLQNAAERPQLRVVPSIPSLPRSNSFARTAKRCSQQQSSGGKRAADQRSPSDASSRRITSGIAAKPGWASSMSGGASFA